MNIPVRTAILALVFGLASSLFAQTLTDTGANAPTPGVNDIAQLSTQGDKTFPDGLNYYTDNNPPVGQTFTTGTNALTLATVAIKTGGLDSGSGYGIPATTPTYYLRIYAISNTTATFLIAFSAANPGFTDGDWLKWSGLNVPLATNRTYAFTFGRQPSGGGYAALAVATNQYPGGEIVTIPISGGLTVTGSSHTFDAGFDLGLRAGFTNVPATMPWPNPTYGMNVGNTLELSGSPPSVALFYAAVQNGFNAVRIPCGWDMNATTNITASATNYLIKSTYMAQVKQTVDGAIAAGMYVMINDHWDDGWLENNIGTNVDPIINAKMKSYWTQIATNFAGYDNHLLFAAANEPNVGSRAAMNTLMDYYQTFVNAVRGADGNNTNRWLVLQGGGDTTWLNALPTDTVSNRLMLEYHGYTPFLFTQSQSDPSWGTMQFFWGPAYHYSADATRNSPQPEEGAIDAGFQQLVEQYVSKGIPVMIGEFQAAAKSVLATNATEAAWNSDSAYYWNKYLVDSAQAHGLSPFYWSTPGSPFDWTTGAITDTQEVTVLTGGVAPPPPNGAPYAVSGLTATASNTNVNLSWTAGSGDTSYSLYRAAESGNEGTNPMVTGITGTTYTDTNLNSGTTYYYLVAAANSAGPTGFSPEAYATTSGTNPDTAQFNFETDVQGWSTDGNPLISGIATSTTQHYAGRQSLAVNIKTNAAGYSSVSVGNVSVVAGQTITFHVWIPSGSQISNIQPYLQDYNWDWTSSWYGSLTANAWNTLTLTVPQTAVAPFHTLGLTFTTGAGWTNTCYVDSISWNTPRPDFSVTANPTSLAVNGGTNETSTISVTATNGLNAVYTLSVSNLPSGVAASFVTNPITGGASLLTLTAANTVISGTTNVTIIATAGLISHTKIIALTLTGPTNTPPVLAAITNQTVNVGQTVAFTASATDTDQPPQTLTFTLLAGATNATLNTNSGAFSFRPMVTQASSTNTFILKVADNGAPSLSATQSFLIVVNLLFAPAVGNVSVAGGQFNFSISGQSGPDYAVETSTNLSQWSNVFTTNSPTPPFMWTATNSNASQRFYRVKLGPPLP